MKRSPWAPCALVMLAMIAAAAQLQAASPAAPGTPTGAARAQDAAAIRAVAGNWMKLYEAGDYASIPDLYTEDTLIMPRGRPRIEGREQMRGAIGGLAAGRRVSMEITERELVILGDYAWVVSDFKVTYTPRDGAGPSTSERGRGLVIFRKDGDGKWRIHRDMDSPAPEPKPAAAHAPRASLD